MHSQSSSSNWFMVMLMIVDLVLGFNVEQDVRDDLAKTRAELALANRQIDELKGQLVAETELRAGLEQDITTLKQETEERALAAVMNERVQRMRSLVDQLAIARQLEEDRDLWKRRAEHLKETLTNFGFSVSYN